MFFGYNINGFAHHRLEDALVILSELGYQGVGLTLDYYRVDPYAPDTASEIRALGEMLSRLGMRCVIETGARFLLDPRRKHQPTLISPTADERRKRIDFLTRAIGIAAELNAEAVSFWSGTPIDDAGSDGHFQRLVEGCREICAIAEKENVLLAFEPEPGMLIDTLDRFERLHREVAHPLFGLTIDIGHLHCQGETPIVDHLYRWQHQLWNVHIEDMRHGIHDHLMFGEGEIDFAPILWALRDIDYSGGVYVELSRHSHDAVVTAANSLMFLKQELHVGPNNDD